MECSRRIALFSAHVFDLMTFTYWIFGFGLLWQNLDDGKGGNLGLIFAVMAV